MLILLHLFVVIVFLHLTLYGSLQTDSSHPSNDRSIDLCNTQTMEREAKPVSRALAPSVPILNSKSFFFNGAYAHFCRPEYVAKLRRRLVGVIVIPEMIVSFNRSS